MINKTLIITVFLWTIHAFGDQYALTVITSSKGNDDKFISHISLYKSKNLCSNKLADINLLLSMLLISFSFKASIIVFLLPNDDFIPVS